MENQNQQPNQENTQQAPGKSDYAKDVEENKLWAFIGYLGLLCLIPLLAKKDSKFAQFHAKQGLVLTIGMFFAWIPLIGWILGIVLFIFWIMGIVSVFQGQMKPLPIVGDLARKINI